MITFKLKFVLLLLLLLLSVSLPACAIMFLPLPNTDPESFRTEYEIVIEVMNKHGYYNNLDAPKLEEMKFVVLDSFEELQQYCDSSPCVGLKTDRATMAFPPLPVDRCQKLSPGEEPTASVIMHEILHTQGFSHGETMKKINNEAWETYKKEFCLQ